MVSIQKPGLRGVLSVAWVCVLTAALLITALPAFAEAPAPDKHLGEGSIAFPPDILKDYSIAAAESLSFAGVDGNYLAIAYMPKEFSMDAPKPSFLVIYKETDKGFDKVFRYLPTKPEDYPMPLLFEKMWTLTDWQEGRQVTTALVTAWGEVGADYWGTHPIVLAYKDNDFRAIPLYEGKLAEDERIKGFSWTSPDFEVDNYFHPSNAVTTILTQGIDVRDGKVVLTFWADEECKACEHKLVNVELDVP